jgi:hypothetical protein
MPKFSQQAIEVKAVKQKGIPQDVVDEYKPYIEQLEKGNQGALEFGEGEDVKLGRKALVEAGVQLKQYVKVRKPRGQENVLNFVLITKKEYDEAKKKAEARGAKLRGKRKK